MRMPFKNVEKTVAQNAGDQEKLQKTTSPEKSVMKTEVEKADISEKPEIPGNAANKADADDRITDDDGNDVNEGESLPPNKTFTLNGIEYKTDDNGKIYSIDRKRLRNITYALDGKVYHTNDSGERILTSEEKQRIKMETGWSDEIIDHISSMAEYEVYKKAGLVEADVGGKKCLIRSDIDWNQKDAMGRTNRERVEAKPPDGPLAPITKNGETVELHHIGQHQNSPFAELTQVEHRGKGNNTVMHDTTKSESEINRSVFNDEKKEYWQARANGGV